MFDNHYPFSYLGKQETVLLEPRAILKYKFKAKYRTYLVRVEEYSFGFYAIKYCDVKDKNNQTTAYQKIFNDGDFFRILATCVYIMFKLWEANPSISFVFYAVPRNITVADIANKKLSPQTETAFLEHYKRTRFNVYEYAMLNLFPPNKFSHINDYQNCIYALVNKNAAQLSMIKALGNFLLSSHDILFEPGG